MDYLNYLNHPIQNIFINIFLVLTILMPILFRKFNNSNFVSYTIIVNLTINLIAINILIVMLFIINQVKLTILIPLLFLIYSTFLFKKKRRIFFLNFFLVKKNFKNFFLEEKIILFIITLFFFSSFLTALDSDSFLYHLAFPFNLIKNDFNFVNYSWFHANLITLSELNNLYGLLFKSENFISFLNFTYFFLFYFFIYEYHKYFEYKFSKIIYFCFPVLYFLIISQKFFFAPMVIIVVTFIHQVFINQKLNFKNHIVFYYAVLSKFTFFYFPFILFFYMILKNCNFLFFYKSFKINLLAGLLTLLLLYFFRYLILDYKFFPFYINDSFYFDIFNFWVAQMSQFLRPNIQNIINLFFPLNFKENITSFLGIYIFIPFLLILYFKKSYEVLILVLFFLFFFLFNQTSSRFLIPIVYISIFMTLPYINILFYRNSIFYKFFIYFSYLQSLSVISLCLYSFIFFGSSIFSENGRYKVLNKYAYDFNGITTVDKYIKDNNLNISYILVSKSNLFSNEKFLSWEFTSSILTMNDILSYQSFKKYLNFYQINHLLISDFDLNNYKFLNCIKKDLIYESPYIFNSSRNLIHKSKKKYYLFSIIDNLETCY